VDGVHIGIQKVDGVHIVQWRRLHLLPLGTAVYYLSDPLFFLKHHPGRGLPGGQRGELGFEPRTGSSTLGDFASCSRHSSRSTVRMGGTFYMLANQPMTTSRDPHSACVWELPMFTLLLELFLQSQSVLIWYLKTITQVGMRKAHMPASQPSSSELLVFMFSLNFFAKTRSERTINWTWVT
jgi:hypothetical protein